MSQEKPIILILGPTAGGKTELSLRLAERLSGGGECICADSMQVYRGMDIGTAKPTAADQARAPHHLLDIGDPADDGFTVDHWLKLAEEAISEIRGRNHWPIVVGGTNLYIKALLEGLFDGPDPDSELRSSLDRMTDRELRAELVVVDPVAAERIHPNDRRRTIRAIEVYRLSGQPISTLQQQWDRGSIRSDVRVIGLEYEVAAINARINGRVRQMIGQGLVQEVSALESGNGMGVQASEALGYKQVLAHLREETTLDEAIEEIKIKTRRFAKQQRTWLRRFRLLPASRWIVVDGALTEEQVAEAIEWLRADPASTSSDPSSGTGAA